MGNLNLIRKYLLRVFLLISSATTLLLSVSAGAAVLDNEQRRTVTLSDGLQVTLIGAAAGANASREYYALPNQLLNSRNAANEPQFLFMSFTTNNRPEDGGSAGGLLHVLVEWGLTPQQERELTEKVSEFGEGSIYKGFVQLLPPGGEQASFALVSGVLSDSGTTSSVVTSGTSPLIAGGKSAIAARLDPNAAQTLFKTFEGDTSVGDLSVTMNFSYATQVQGPKGVIKFDWNGIELRGETLEAEYKETYGWAKDRDRCWLFWRCDSPTVTYSYDEAHSQYEFLMEQNLVSFEFEEGFPSERAGPIRDAFIQYFINTMSDPAPPPARPVTDDGEEEASTPDIRQGSHYTYYKERTSSIVKQKTKRFSMNYKFQVKWPHQITGNIKEWKNNAEEYPHAYQKVILDDPFFTWRDVIFTVDLDSEALFAEQANFVTVDVEKRREQGVWRESVTIDKKFIEENGITAGVTYARGDDRNSDSYRYKYQWALRGGLNYPENPQWQEGSWEGISLVAPIQSRTLEFEADLNELKSSDITRATAQIRYPRLGREEEANMHISVAKGSPLVEKQIFADREAAGYVYRLVLNHRRFGRLATPWSAQLSDNYIYALIPEELLVASSEDEQVIVDAQAAANSPNENVLDDFQVLVTGGD